jgi:hypothetical protein
MAFTCKEIAELQNPYETLGTSDALAEHRDELDKLDPKQMEAVAKRMVLACPKDDMNTFGHAINALKSGVKKDTSFHTTLYQAYEVKKRILSLFDPKNKNPHNTFLDLEYNEELFQKYNELALSVLEKSESSVASRLAFTTPKEKRSVLTRNISRAFPDSSFASKTAAAFTLLRDIEQFLLGDKPEQFFSSREFSVDLCIEFSALLSTLIQGHEETIGKKLSTLNDQTIKSKLDLIKSGSHDKEGPFKKITISIASKIESQAAPVMQVGTKAKSTQTSPHVLFNTKTGKSGQAAASLKVEQKEDDLSSLDSDTDDDEEFDDNCNRPFCGLF